MITTPLVLIGIARSLLGLNTCDGLACFLFLFVCLLSLLQEEQMVFVRFGSSTTDSLVFFLLSLSFLASSL